MPRQFGTTGLQALIAAPAVGPAGSTYYNTALKLHFLSDGARWFEVSSDYIASRGPGLVTNGSALLGTNYNWNTYYDLVKSDHPVGAAGSFQVRGSAAQATFCDEFIPVDPAGYYDMTFAFRQVAGDASRTFYSLIAPYDADKLNIVPQTYMEQAGTRTTLAADLKNGDTQIFLTSSANWNNAAGGLGYLRTVVVWNYVDGQGYAWPAGTYSRTYRSDCYADGGIVGNVITLRTPWNGLPAPAGTPISNGSSGSNFMYGASSLLAPSAWANYGPYRYGGVHTNLTLSAGRSFPAATSYVQVGFLHNYPNNDPTAISRMANVNLVQVSAVAKQGLPAAGTAGQVLVKNTATDYDAAWSNPAGPSGAAGGSLAGSYPNPTLGSGVVVDATVAAAAAIAQSKIAGLPAALTAKQDAGAAAGGDLSGTYPNPQIAAGVIVDADISPSAAIAQSKLQPLPVAPVAMPPWSSLLANIVGVHPELTVQNYGLPVILDEIGNLRVPPMLITADDSAKWNNATLPSAYPFGVSVVTVSGAAATAGGWPAGSAVVLTVKRFDAGMSGVASAFQIWSQGTSVSANVALKYRSGAGSPGAWTSWFDIGVADTGWVAGGSGATVVVANATNITLTNSWARAVGGRVQFFMQFTMKVASSTASGDMNIINLPVGTAASAFIPTGAPMDQPLGPVGTGRVVSAYITPAGSIQIAAIGGSTALAVGEQVTLGGSYLL